MKQIKQLNNLLIVIGVIFFALFISFVNTSCSGEENKTNNSGPFFNTEIIFPFQGDHVHASTIVELSNGDLLAGWFQGSGERWADDVQIMGSRKKNGQKEWSQSFVLADVKDFPDCNPILFLDGKDRLWLMWYTVIANQWETSLLKYRISEDYLNMEGSPVWAWQEDLHIKPGAKAERGIQPDDPFVESVRKQAYDYAEYLKSSPELNVGYERWNNRIETLLSKARGENMIREGRIYKEDGQYETAPLGYPYFSRMGWQTRNKPLITASGRMIVPLYSDGFGCMCLMAYTDDWGEEWKLSTPIVGGGNEQAAIVQSTTGELVAYMRDGGSPPKRLHISRSEDNGETWSPVRDTEIPNPGSACDIVTLKNGNWILIYNDTESGRNSLAVALSEDEGKTWPWHKYIISEEVPVQAHYPAIIVGRNGDLHISYSYFLPDNQKTIKYAVFNEEWIKSKQD